MDPDKGLISFKELQPYCTPSPPHSARFSASWSRPWHIPRCGPGGGGQAHCPLPRVFWLLPQVHLFAAKGFRLTVEVRKVCTPWLKPGCPPSDGKAVEVGGRRSVPKKNRPTGTLVCWWVPIRWSIPRCSFLTGRLTLGRRKRRARGHHAAVLVRFSVWLVASGFVRSWFLGRLSFFCWGGVTLLRFLSRKQGLVSSSFR